MSEENLLDAHFAGKLTYDAECGQINIAWKYKGDHSNLALDVRGWGYLTSEGALKLPHDVAMEMQNKFANNIVKCVNENVSLHARIKILEYEKRRFTQLSIIRETELLLRHPRGSFDIKQLQARIRNAEAESERLFNCRYNNIEIKGM